MWVKGLTLNQHQESMLQPLWPIAGAPVGSGNLTDHSIAFMDRRNGQISHRAPLN